DKDDKITNSDEREQWKGRHLSVERSDEAWWIYGGPEEVEHRRCAPGYFINDSST
ncbi:31777_t:CDS:2, partial [Racocetra persica]